jgi:hypothetical protein
MFIAFNTFRNVFYPSIKPLLALTITLFRAIVTQTRTIITF